MASGIKTGQTPTQVPAQADARFTPLGPQLPQRGNAFSRWLGLWLLRRIDWRMNGTFPDVPKAMVIVAPHTSNYDGLVTVAILLALGLRLSFFMKHTAFPWPLGRLIRWFGGVPVNRDASQDLVAYSASKFAENDKLLVAIAPEGTRHAAESWKTGFYWIALRAQVPIICIGFDYARREVRILDTFTPSGDVEKDMPLLVSRFADVTPRREDRLSRPLRELREQNARAAVEAANRSRNSP